MIIIHRIFLVKTEPGLQIYKKFSFLNRVSGRIDMGFAPEDNSYHSEHHYKPGPFGRQNAAADKSQYGD